MNADGVPEPADTFNGARPAVTHRRSGRPGVLLYVGKTTGKAKVRFDTGEGHTRHAWVPATDLLLADPDPKESTMSRPAIMSATGRRRHASSAFRPGVTIGPDTPELRGYYLPLIESGNGSVILDTDRKRLSYAAAEREARDLARIGDLIIDALFKFPVPCRPLRPRMPAHRCLQPDWDEHDGCERCDIEAAMHERDTTVDVAGGAF